MSAVIIEHVKVSDLPATWRAKLSAPEVARVTVRIEEESAAPAQAAGDADARIEQLFGMWSDREDMADVDAYIRKLRAPRYNRDGSRNTG